MKRRHITTMLVLPALAASLLAGPAALAAEAPVPDNATQWGSVVIGGQGGGTLASTSPVTTPAWVTGSTVVKIDGGTWSYGTNTSIVWSNYLHPTRHHGSTVRTYNGGITVRSAVALPGRWSVAQVRRSTNTNEAFYWLV